MHSAQQIYSAKQGSSAASLQPPHATPLCTQLSGTIDLHPPAPTCCATAPRAPCRLREASEATSEDYSMVVPEDGEDGEEEGSDEEEDRRPTGSTEVR